MPSLDAFDLFNDPATLSSMTLKVVIQRGEDGYFSAHCPALKSCWSQGRTRDEALQNIREAIDLYLEPAPSEVIEDAEHEVVALAL
jgi:predicted RNase H-like HicB family nuclease